MRSEQQKNGKSNYDFIVVGAGPSGAMFVYRAIEKNPNVRILMIERGRRVEKRVCPGILAGKCLKCKNCCITAGFGGGGAFSDGKYSLTNEEDSDIYVGGTVHHYIGVPRTKYYIHCTDQVYLKFGATQNLEGIGYPTEVAKIRKKAQIAGLDLINIPIRHWGTDRAREMYELIQNYLLNSGCVDIRFETDVSDLIISDGKIEGVEYVGNGERCTAYAPKVILAVGRSGSKWLEGICKKYKITSDATILDIGIRYELPDAVMAKINKYLYEGKFKGKPAPFHDDCRTFCQNPSGFVSAEAYQDGLTLVNGHSCKDDKSENTNLALLVTIKLADVENPMEYSRSIARNLNALAKGNVMVQRLGDVRLGKRTWPEELNENSVVPTLKSAVPGDLSLGIPYRVMSDILGFIDMLEEVIPGFAHPDNLLYGAELKFYSNKLKLDERFESNISGLHAIGDGPGVTRGLSQASANGYYLADVIV